MGEFMSDNELFEVIGKNVSYYRRLYSLEKEKMTQERLAEMVGVSTSVIGGLESKKVNQYDVYGANLIEKGTDARDATIAKRSSVGINSWWKLVMATYIPGSNNVIKNEAILINFSKFANWNFILLSSGDSKKSINTAGTIKA